MRVGNPPGSDSAFPVRPVNSREAVSHNAGDTFEIRASALASESTYAWGIVRMVSAAQTAKSPFIRMLDRYALLPSPITLAIAGGAWFFSNDPVRGPAVLVAERCYAHLFLSDSVAFDRRGYRLSRFGGCFDYAAIGTRCLDVASRLCDEAKPGQKRLKSAASARSSLCQCLKTMGCWVIARVPANFAALSCYCHRERATAQRTLPVIVRFLRDRGVWSSRRLRCGRAARC